LKWVIESKAEGADASPRTASRNDPREWDDLRQGNSAFIHSAPTGDSEIPFRKIKKLEFPELPAAWPPCRESRADVAAAPRVPRRPDARGAVLR
jgi:hypothetical protein